MLSTSRSPPKSTRTSGVRWRSWSAADDLDLCQHSTSTQAMKAPAEHQIAVLQIRLHQAAAPRIRKDLLNQLALAEQSLSPPHLDQHRFAQFLRARSGVARCLAPDHARTRVDREVSSCGFNFICSRHLKGCHSYSEAGAQSHY